MPFLAVHLQLKKQNSKAWRTLKIGDKKREGAGFFFAYKLKYKKVSELNFPIKITKIIVNLWHYDEQYDRKIKYSKTTV